MLQKQPKTALIKPITLSPFKILAINILVGILYLLVTNYKQTTGEYSVGNIFYTNGENLNNTVVKVSGDSVSSGKRGDTTITGTFIATKTKVLQHKKIINAVNYLDASTIKPKEKRLKTLSSLVLGIKAEGIIALNIEELPPLDMGMVNVTDNKAGYKIQSNNNNPKLIAIKFLNEDIPAGYTIGDVHTYFYNKTTGHWNQLKRDSLDITNNIIYSTNTEDGDYINAIIKVPESPETQGYMPTTMSEIKVGDPASMIQNFESPKANNQGSANLSFVIETPRGRQGIEPHLSISYNSDGGNGWLGEGWNLNGLSSITLDSRWGVPRYDTSFETETYILDGQMLAFVKDGQGITPHRNRGVPRTDNVRQFYPRKLSDFKKIIRHGNKPDNYWWEITDKLGTKYFYGGFEKFDPLAVLRDESSGTKNIAEWKLCHVEDVFGNYMNYQYEISITNVLGSGTVKANNIYLKSITYTGFKKPGTTSEQRPPNYAVNIYRVPKQGYEINLNGRYGFLTAMADSLLRITVAINYLGEELSPPKIIRSYQFKYETGAFGKTLLAGITQLGSKGTKFFEQKFDYYSQPAKDSFFSPPPVLWNTPSDNISGKLINPITSKNSTAIGSSASGNKGYSMYFGLGILGNPTAKDGTVGVQFGSNTSNSNGLITLLDVSGDGRPDKLFVKDNKLQYHLNNGNGFNADIITIIGLDGAQFYKESTRSSSTGYHGSFGSFSVGTDKTSSESTTDTYTADKNGDGLIDIVVNGVVFFNIGYRGDRTHHFNRYSSATGIPINTVNTITGFAPAYSTGALDSLEKENPLHEVVRVWEAPLDGKIKLYAPVKMIKPSVDEQESPEFNKIDGLVATIQRGAGRVNTDSIVATKILAPGNYDSALNTNYSFYVTKGQRIYFRLQSGTKSSSDGSFDRVAWSPQITYDLYDSAQFQKDIFYRNIYQYDAAKDFLLSNPGALVLDSGVARFSVTGVLKKKVTEDEVNVSIVQLKQEIIFKPDGNIKSVKYVPEITLFDTVLSPKLDASLKIERGFNVTSKERLFAFRIQPKTNLDISRVNWTPVVRYKKSNIKRCMDTSGVIVDCGVEEKESDPIYITPHFVFSDSLNTYAQNWKVPDTSNFQILTSLRFKDTVRSQGSFLFTVRDTSGLITRQVLEYSPGTIFSQGVKIKLPLNKDQQLMPSYELLDTLDVAIETPQFELVNDSTKSGISWIKGADTIIVQEPKIFDVKYPGTYLVHPHVQLQGSNQQGKFIYQVINATTGAIIATDSLKFRSNTVTYPVDALAINLPADAKRIKLRYIAPDSTFSTTITVAKVQFNQSIPASLWTKRLDEKFGPMYRGWGQFVYNGMGKRADSIIKEAYLVINLSKAKASKDEAEAIINRLKANDSSTNVQINNIDDLSPVKAIFSKMGPFVDSSHYQWRGGDDDIYLSAGRMSSSRLGENFVSINDPFLLTATAPPSPDKSFGFAVNKVVRYSNRTNYAGAGQFSINGSSTNDSRMVSDFIDLNGDRFPDIVGNKQVQLTNSLGGLENKAVVLNFLHTSGNSSLGIGWGGGIYHSGGGGTSRSGGNNNSGKAATVSASSTATTTNASVYIGASASANIGEDHINTTWMDVNSDGLPDQVSINSVALNLGNNNFTVNIPYITGTISSGRNMSVSPGVSLGVSYSNQSFSAGLGLSLSTSNSAFNLQDFNGDGLIDQVAVDEEGNVVVNINQGIGFLPPLPFGTIAIPKSGLQSAGSALLPIRYIPSVKGFKKYTNPIEYWVNLERTKLSGSIGESLALGGSFTYGFNAWIPLTPLIRFVFNPAVNVSQGMGKNYRQFTDIDGDGFLDYLYSTNESSLYVSLSTLGKVNKLKTLTNPLGGEYTIDYKHSEPSLAHPGGKWIMSSLAINDGVNFDRADTSKKFDAEKSFKYSDGNYDRYEREFLGFGKVVTNDLNFDGTILRSNVQVYDTSNYYVAGNLLQESIQKSPNELFTKKDNQYYLYLVKPSASGDYASRATTTNETIRKSRLNDICFSVLKKSTNYNFERKTTPIVLNESMYTYNNTGAVNNFKYKEGGVIAGSNFDYETDINLTATNAAKYIIDQPQSMTVKKGSRIYRQVLAKYYTANGRLEKAIKRLNASEYDTTVFKYSKFGNISTKELPSGIEYTYEYDDDETNTFLKAVKDNFSLTSYTTYDKGFGIPKQTKDINDNIINYELDEFGRIKRIIGPKECNNEITDANCKDKFTILVAYSIADAPLSTGIAVSKLTHFDPDHPSLYSAQHPLTATGIQTLNFIDGFGRSVQVKKTAAISNANGTPNAAVKWTVSGRVIYDAAGRAIKTYYPTTDNTNDGLAVSKLLPAVNPSKNEFDPMDRIVKSILPDDSISFIAEFTTLDNLSLNTTTFYNTGQVGGNPAKLAYNNGSGLLGIDAFINPQGDTVKTKFTYDPIHQLSTVTDNKGNLTTTTYDIAGRKVGYDHADAGNILYVYNRASQLMEKINAEGEHTIYTYDLNRLVGINYPGHPENNVRYVYGAKTDKDNGNCSQCRGRIIYQEDATGAQAFEYGSQGEIKKTIRTIVTPFNGKTYTFATSYDYDSWNRIQSITYPDNEKLEHTYNEAGLLKQITGKRGNNTKLPALYKAYKYVANISYDEFDQRTFLEYGNGTKTTYTYQPKRRRLDSMQIGKATIFFTSDYKYDNQNNIIQYKSSSVRQPNALLGVSMVHNYRYDNVNRLDSANGTWTLPNNNASYGLKMGYDDLFNVTKKYLDLKSGKIKTDYDCSFTYDSQNPHQLSQLRETSHRNADPFYDQDNKEFYSYDGKGNNTWKGIGISMENQAVQERKILWDEENRILAVSMSGYVSSYVYGADGERAIKLSTEGDGVYINGKFAADYIKPATFSLYANPYYSMRNGEGLYTKHIYIESQRIVSQVENDNSFDNQDITPGDLDPTKRARSISTISPQVPDYYNKKHLLLNAAINSYYDSLRVPHQWLKADAFLKNPPNNDTKILDNPYDQYNKSVEKLPKVGGPALVNSYYYHFNHIGSSSLITDIDGIPVQYVEYLPFGETFMEQRQNYSSQYVFNGKEQDQETGLYYYGARYYDPHSYQWLGIDPKAEMAPGLSPYNYCLNNPVVFTDPDGKFIDIVADVGFLAYDIYEAGMEYAETGKVSATTQMAIAADVAGILVPFATGGGMAVRGAAKAGNAINHGADVVKTADKVNDAGKSLSGVGDVGEGIIYKRVDKTGTQKDYIGQTKSDARYEARQKEHSRSNKNADYEFEILERGKPGKDLNQKEQKHLDQHGGPTNKSNPNGGTSNKRNVIQKQE